MLFIKGIIIGIGKIIPGVSGSMLAISMGIYEQLVNSVNNLFKDFKKNIKFLAKIGFGIAISIILFSNIILKCLDSYYIITMFLFMGLILGSFSDIKKEITKKNNYMIIFIIILVVVLGLLNGNNNINIENKLLNFIFFIFIGIVDAITMVVPGISGTATLMALGVYNTLMSAFSSLLILDMLSDNLVILLPFSIGIIIGTFVTTKIISYLFKNHSNSTYNAIYGFGISTILIMAIKCFKSNYNLIELIISFILLIVGYIISKKINQANFD